MKPGKWKNKYWRHLVEQNQTLTVMIQKISYREKRGEQNSLKIACLN